MSAVRRTFGRREVLKAGLASVTTSVLAMAPFSRAWAAYPERNLNVVVPTSAGGGAERLARAFAEVWPKLLGPAFEYEFFPGASGQVGYELYIRKRERTATTCCSATWARR